VPDSGFTTLTSERLVLRRFVPGDAGALAAYRDEPEVARYQSWDRPYTLDRARRFIMSLEAADPDTPGEWFQFAVSLRSEGNAGLVGGPLLGDVALVTLAEDPAQAEIGFSFATAAQGRGYATEAVARLLDYLFGDRRKHRVRASCDARNLRSAALLERVGMRREGRLAESWHTGDGWADELLYAVLEREWARGAWKATPGPKFSAP
jgi:aminoglycoside 6'-N-acetyltransferase